MIDYLKQHWRGQLPLAQAFWLNFVLLFIALEALGSFLFPPYIDNEAVVTGVALLFILLSKVIVYSWQLVGVLRVCALCITNDSGRHWAMVAQTAMAGSLVFVVVSSLDIYQDLRVYQERQILLKRPPPPAGYSLELMPQRRLIRVRGPFEVGITSRVEALLAQHRGITGIILDSEGGQIYEGRGLARLIREHRLNTFSLEHCLSSCTTAYIAGVERVLGAKAKLGFHQYKTYSVIPSINVPEEQVRDMTIFRQQGVAAEFLDKAFSYPPESMWWPNHDELIAAGVVHRIDSSLGD